jgi:hypothetical protein
MASKTKITTGANDRPKDETIAQSGEGLPDDLADPVEVDESAVERARQNLEESPRKERKRKVEEEIESSQKGAE